MERLKRSGRRLISPLVRLLAAMRISPTAVTVAALPMALVSAWLFATGRFFIGGLVNVLVGMCDSLDGELSRLTGRGSRVGAFLDSTVDRFGEAIVLGGMYWFYHDSEPLFATLAAAALVFSLLVSYVRARAEGAGFECAVGFFERPVRFIIFLVGAFIPGRFTMVVVLGVITAGSLITVVHRVVYVLAQGKRS